MQHILAKYGFQRCGIIYVKNGTERIAYQKNTLIVRYLSHAVCS